MFLIRSKDRFLVGRGVRREWRATTFKEALAMLQDIRTFPGWKMGYLSYEFGMKWQGVESHHADEFETPLLHFVVPESVKFVEDIFEKSSDLEFSASSPRHELSPEEYANRIAQIHEYLRDGETYEVNFAQRFQGEFEGDPLALFLRLNDLNPSPHACFLDLEPVTVVSCSPERLVSGSFMENEQNDRDDNSHNVGRVDESNRMSGGRRMIVETRPIKGTVPRGKTPEADQRAIAELLASEKNEAELNMIVDLARNDLGKVCEVGSVEVTEHRAIESYSHVHHTMSNVRGLLETGRDWVDVLKAVFPGGSVTGAPKKRTMELIDRLEPCARGIYTGSAGYISPEGEFDFNILIRTIALQRQVQGSQRAQGDHAGEQGPHEGDRGRYSFHSGGGIVMDSEASSEYSETLDKAAALLEGLSG